MVILALAIYQIEYLRDFLSLRLTLNDINDKTTMAIIAVKEALAKKKMQDAYDTLLQNLENAIKEYNIEHGLEVQ